MTDHLTDNDMTSYRNRGLAPKDIVAANDHLFSCTLCFSRFKVLIKSSGKGFSPVGYSDGNQEATCLQYEDMKAYIDDEISRLDRTRILIHLGKCDICRSEVADLLLFKNLQSEPEFPDDRESGSLGRKDEIRRLKQLVVRRPSLLFGAGSLAIASVILILGWFFVVAPLHRENSRLTSMLRYLQKDVDTQQARDLTPANPSPPSEVADTQAKGSGGPPGGPDSLPAIELSDDGRVIRLERGELTGLKDSPFASMVKAVLETSRISHPSLRELKPKHDVLMGDQSESVQGQIKAPVASVVQDDRPVFSWSAVPNSVAYSVTIMDLRSRKLIKSPMIQATQWRPPEPLSRGEIYSWDLKVVIDGGPERYIPAPPAPRAMFKVLGRAEAEQIREASQASRPSHLVMAVLYARYGLIDDARTELKYLADSNPKSKIIETLMRQVGPIR